jgi:mRNA-degrading endonuclease RelE of RelBE toxin-antitoxin system
MQLEWSLAAGSYLDQLPPSEQSKVLHAVEQLSADWDNIEGTRLHRLIGDHDDLWSLRAGSEFRVLVRRSGDLITVVDVVRRSQIDGLRRAAERHATALG